MLGPCAKWVLQWKRMKLLYENIMNQENPEVQTE